MATRCIGNFCHCSTLIWKIINIICIVFAIDNLILLRYKRTMEKSQTPRASDNLQVSQKSWNSSINSDYPLNQHVLMLKDTNFRKYLVDILSRWLSYNFLFLNASNYPLPDKAFIIPSFNLSWSMNILNLKDANNEHVINYIYFFLESYQNQPTKWNERYGKCNRINNNELKTHTHTQKTRETIQTETIANWRTATNKETFCICGSVTIRDLISKLINLIFWTGHRHIMK